MGNFLRVTRASDGVNYIRVIGLSKPKEDTALFTYRNNNGTWSIKSNYATNIYNTVIDSPTQNSYLICGSATGEKTWEVFSYKLTEIQGEDGTLFDLNIFEFSYESFYGQLKIKLKSTDGNTYNVKQFTISAKPEYNGLLYTMDSSWQTQSRALENGQSYVLYAQNSSNTFKPDTTKWDFDNTKVIALFSGGTDHEITSDGYDYIDDFSFSINESGELKVLFTPHDERRYLYGVCGFVLNIPRVEIHTGLYKFPSLTGGGTSILGWYLVPRFDEIGSTSLSNIPSVYFNSDPYRHGTITAAYDADGNNVLDQYDMELSTDDREQLYVIYRGKSGSAPKIQNVDIVWDKGYKYILGFSFSWYNYGYIDLIKGNKHKMYIHVSPGVCYPWDPKMTCVGTCDFYNGLFTDEYAKYIKFEAGDDGLAYAYLDESAPIDSLRITYVAVT